MTSVLPCCLPLPHCLPASSLESTSNFVKGVYNGRGGHVVYGVFTTPANSLGASAICAFRLDDMKAAFDGQFKGQEDASANWLPIANSKVPDHDRESVSTTRVPFLTRRSTSSRITL